jgi:maltose alpha-D-glucosyltransferase/alpha-amylase
MFDSDPLWHKDAIIYEVHVRAFSDSGEDGVGDFRGLTERLDYLQDLGVTAVWLLPFFPSPWRDDGYDISDYTNIHSAYGTLRDFQIFLKQAHRRGIRVITEVVLNHTSDQHPWFQRARRAQPGTRWRDFYVWSDRADKYSDARIIFKDFETSNWTWDPVAKAYYWHRFYSHQPDLNYDSPDVRQACLEVIDFWLDIGVDGFRLDAIPYLYERPGTNCENLPETHAFLQQLRKHVDEKYKDRILLAEANQWPDDAAAYFGSGDECHMAFHFPLMPRLFMSIRSEDRFPVLEILQETPTIPPSCQWALFLRNHDELTLEMVTDEERDYMYRVYAQERLMRINLGIRRRLAPLLENDRRKIELMNALLFSLPGTPVLYYGDEIGMGDNVYLGDRNGVRTPMQWSADRNAGFSRANPQKLYLPITIDPQYHYESVNVEAQQNNPHSLLWWTKHLIEHRKKYKAFGRGSLEFLRPPNRKVLAFYRRYQDQTILVVANLSRFPQHVELDLCASKGLTPVEIFGHTEFPPIGDQPYIVTLAALGFYWFSLESKRVRQESVANGPAAQELPVVSVSSFQDIFQGRSLEVLVSLMPDYLKTRQWFAGKNRSIRSIGIVDEVPIPSASSQILLGRIEYTEGDPELYILPGAVAAGRSAEEVRDKLADVSVMQLRTPEGAEGILYSAAWNPEFGAELLGAIARRRRFHGKFGELIATHNRAFRKAWGVSHPDLEAAALRTRQSNTAIVFGDRFILKIYRRVEPGIHPEIETDTFLQEQGFEYISPLTGTIDYRAESGGLMTVAALHAFVANQGDVRSYTLHSLSQFFEHALATKEVEQPNLDARRHPFEIREEFPAGVHEIVGAYLSTAQLLGQRTAELHLALSSDPSNPDFAPEPFTDHYRQSLYHGMMVLAAQTFQLVRQRLSSVTGTRTEDVREVLERQDEIRARFRAIPDRRVASMRIRLHDNLQLEQVLHTGKDFIFIGLGGRSEKSLSERRIKRSPWRDVASMLLSFHCAANAVLFDEVPGITHRAENAPALEKWAAYWCDWVSSMYLKGYFESAGRMSSLSLNDADVRLLLEAFVIERALEELGRDLIDHPEHASIPARVILRLLNSPNLNDARA